MAMSALATAFAAAATLAAGQLEAQAPAPLPDQARAGAIVIGHSAQGRPIRAVRVGSARARVKLLVVGVIHGNERAGTAVVERLRRSRPPRGTALWLIEDANPDGSARRDRATTPRAWTSTATSPTAGGRRTGSTSPAPGRRRSPRPRRSSASSRRSARARRSGTTRRSGWWSRAPATRCSSASTRGRAACRAGACRATTERRPPGRTRPFAATARSWSSCRAERWRLRRVRRHAGAVLGLGRALAPPRVVNKPIPFGDDRKADMRAYARRHYGIDDYLLRKPKVIVEHYTVTSTFRAGLRHLRPERAGPGAARAARRLRALRDRPRRDDLPARLHADHVPPHGRPQLDRDRDRARGHERRPGDGQPRASWRPRCA